MKASNWMFFLFGSLFLEHADVFYFCHRSKIWKAIRYYYYYCPIKHLTHWFLHKAFRSPTPPYWDWSRDCDMSRSTTKPTKWHVPSAKTQNSLGSRPVWSVFAVRLKTHWVFSYTLNAQRRLWAVWANAQAHLSLRRAHMSFCWFCRAPANYLYHY